MPCFEVVFRGTLFYSCTSRLKRSWRLLPVPICEYLTASRRAYYVLNLEITFTISVYNFGGWSEMGGREAMKIWSVLHISWTSCNSIWSFLLLTSISCYCTGKQRAVGLVGFRPDNNFADQTCLHTHTKIRSKRGHKRKKLLIMFVS